MNMNTIFKKFMALVAIIAGFLTSGKANAQEKYSPSGTYQFAVKDGNSLFLDEYLATAGSETTLNGNEKPSIVFVFGGGFKGGERSLSVLSYDISRKEQRCSPTQSSSQRWSFSPSSPG